ncbi:unnamed protein product [Sphagnum compactum]
MLHAPGESGTRSLLRLKFSSEAWHQWVGVLKLVRNREWRSDLSSILVEFWGTHHEHDGPVHKEYLIH